MQKKFLEHIKKNSLIKAGNTVILGVSGGPDSVCLLVLLEKIKKALDFNLILVHINYRLRKKEADLDEKLVRKYAKRFDEKLYVFKPKVTKKDEATLRQIRYRYFLKAQTKEKAEIIMTAHTLDDQVETFLLFLLRGSGLDGLQGIKMKSGSLVRPLLFVTKSEIIRYLRKNKLPFRIDQTNLQNNYQRNEIRNKLLPYLEGQFNPNIKRSLERTIFHLSNDADFLNQETKKAFSSTLVSKTVRSIVLDRKKWQKLHPSLKMRVLRQAIFVLKGNLLDVTNANILEILKLLEKKEDVKETKLPKRLRLSTSHDKIRLSF